jgi:thiol:disulfide interchange protein DsbA
MSAKTFFLRALAIASIGLAAAFAPASHAQTQQYAKVEPAQPSDTPGKIEVLEFFAYSCPHCNAMEPIVEAWATTLPDNVVVRAVPVAFNASMVDMQKLYYALESLNRLDLHPEVFKAIHKQHQRLFDAKAITNWVVEKGVDRKAFEDVFNSFGVQTKVARADELAKSYGIDGTPTLAIGGQYITSPSMAGGYEATIGVAQRLLASIMNK